MNKALLILLFSFTSQSIQYNLNGQNELGTIGLKAIQEKSQTVIDKILQETGIPSISLAMVNNGEIIWTEAFGFANVHSQTKATTETIYNTGSTLKFMTATLTMILVQEGKLELDLPINTYIDPDLIAHIDSSNTKITLRQLLSHSSGLYSNNFQFLPIWSELPTPTYSNLIADIYRASPSLTAHLYCNSCFGLVAHILETVSKSKFQDLLVEKLFKPLEIQIRNPIYPNAMMQERMAIPYELFNNNPYPVHYGKEKGFAAGLAYLTPSDYAKFLILHLNKGKYKEKELLNIESINELQSLQFDKYGLGVGIKIDEPTLDTYLMHSGYINGYCTVFKASSINELGIYIMSNGGNSHSILADISDYIFDLFLQTENTKMLDKSYAKPTHTVIPLDSNKAQEIIGTYSLDSYTFFINLDKYETLLFSVSTDLDPNELICIKQDTFILKGVDNVLLKFNRDVEGNITSIHYEQDENKYTFTRNK